MSPRRLARAATAFPAALRLATYSARWLTKADQRKHLLKWWTSLLPGRSGFGDGRPWMNFDTIAWLQEEICEDWQIFEYGSGGSTIFFSRRAAHVTSVEHDATWYGVVRAALEKENLVAKCDYRLIEAEPASTGCSAGAFRSAVAAYRDLQFRAYVEQINGVADGTLDLVVVDGRARVDCAVQALPKLREHGYLLLDNAQRTRYQAVFDRLGRPFYQVTGCTPYQTIPATTAIWRISARSPASISA